MCWLTFQTVCCQLIPQRALDCEVLDSLGHSLLLLTKQRDGIPLLVQSTIYNTGGGLKTSYKMVLSSGELSISHGTQTFNPQLWDKLWQQKYRDTYLYICSFFTAQLTTIIQPDRQWQIRCGRLNQLVATILGDHLATAMVKASPLALWLRGNAHPQERCGEANMWSHWDRDGQTGQQWFFFSEKELLRKPSSMISSGGAGLLQAKCCQKPARWSWALFFNSISLLPQAGRAEHMKTAFTEKHQQNQYRIKRGH